VSIPNRRRTKNVGLTGKALPWGALAPGVVGWLVCWATRLGLGLDSCGLRGRDRIVKLEELLDPGHLHGIAHTGGYADQGQVPAILLVGHVGSNQRADAGGIDVGNLGEVQNEGGSTAAPDQGLKLKEIGEKDGPAQA